MENKKDTLFKKKVAVFLYRHEEEPPGVVFLMLRRPQRRGGFWQPVTGSVENSEDLRESALREVLEETGLDDVTLHDEPCYTFTFRKHSNLYEEYVFGAETKFEDIRLSNEHEVYVWVSYDEALDSLYWESNKEGLRRLARQMNLSPQLP